VRVAVLRASLVASAAIVAAGTLIVRGNSCGHDFDFHLLSWMEVARAWHAGLLYPHWVQEANFGAGEPRLMFYPPASWLLGGLLGTISGWHAAPVLFVLLALVGAGGSMYLLAREWANPAIATFAACVYLANPYAMFVAYERSALGELLAGAWLPLMVLFALRTRLSIAPLGLSVAALWLTNSPAAVMGSYLLAILALGMWIAEGRLWPALRAAGGMALGLGLAAFYIVPAAFEQRWVQINRAIMPGMRVEDSFLFAHTGDAFHDQVLRTASWILVGEFAVAFFAAYFAWKRQPGVPARMALTAVLPIILLLQLPISEPLWTHAPHLKFLQFPWRWLLALSLVACVLMAMALKRVPVVLPILLVAMAIGGGLLFFQPCDDEDAVSAQVAAFRLGQGTEGTDEYTPIGADNASIQQHLPLVRVLRGAQDDTADSTLGDNPEWKPGDAGSAIVDARRPDGEHWLVRITTPERGYAVLRLMDYPSWRVTVDGKPAPGRPIREDGLMAVPLMPGSHKIEVRWFATQDVIAGRELSSIALLALAIVAVLERRERRV
jgi:6-pyruvoyl-tetrahydropterin synthase related domain